MESFRDPDMPEENIEVGWVETDYARQWWADAPADLDMLIEALDTAYEGCFAFAPALPLDPVSGVPLVPSSYRQAQIAQARENLQAAQRDGDVVGYGDGFAIRARPLSQAVKSLLRPVSGKVRLR